MHFQVNLKRFLIKLLVQLSENFFLYLVPSLEPAIKIHDYKYHVKEQMN